MDVLLSIKPKYADKIFSGEKKWEYRKKIWKTEGAINKIVVYASAPISRIIGEFNIEYIVPDVVNKIWHMTGQWGGVDAHSFLEYFGYNDFGYAIKVVDPVRYDKPKPLSDYGIKRPPQNFMYLR